VIVALTLCTQNQSKDAWTKNNSNIKSSFCAFIFILKILRDNIVVSKMDMSVKCTALIYFHSCVTVMVMTSEGTVCSAGFIMYTHHKVMRS